MRKAFKGAMMWSGVAVGKGQGLALKLIGFFGFWAKLVGNSVDSRTLLRKSLEA